MNQEISFGEACYGLSSDLENLEVSADRTREILNKMAVVMDRQWLDAMYDKPKPKECAYAGDSSFGMF